MTYQPINLKDKLAKFSDQWAPKVIAQMNDYQIKLSKLQGQFIWHKHDETDETFVIIEGELTLEFRDGSVVLKPGEMFVVPKGVEHRPFAAEECHVLVIEPAGVVNTGNAGGDRTAPNDVWI